MFFITTVEKSRNKQKGLTMKRLFAVVLACLVLGCMLKGITGYSCGWSGFGGCECNILGACDTSGNPKPGLDNKLTGYAPSGVEQFSADKKFPGSPPNLAYLCEGNTVAILYDCDARIPLYAATMMRGDQLTAKYVRPRGGFRTSGDKKLDRYFQQSGADYKHSKQRETCFESIFGYHVVPDWYSAAQPGKRVGVLQPCNPPYRIRTPVHKGHLIASQYGRGYPDRSRATFTYTNVVPQFGVFNSGQWNRAESDVIEWGKKNCAIHNGNSTRNARMYIVVGAIPSKTSIFSPLWFFGESGFSSYQGRSRRADTYGRKTGKKEYRVNVPLFLWTAVCCTFQFQDNEKKWQDGVQSKAFYRENEPSRKPNYQSNIFNLPWIINLVRVFPQNSKCTY